MKTPFSRHAIALIALFAAAAQALGDSVYFFEPQDDATVTSPVKVQFAVEGKTVHPADGIVDNGSGHFHLLIDVPSIPAGEAIPFDAAHMHFGKGQTEAEIELTPGDHTLTLLFADGLHRSYGPELSKTIKIHVQ